MTSADADFSCHGNQVKFNTKPGFPKSRCKHVCCSHENHVYLFAGKDGHLSLKDLWRYDLATSTWESLSYHGDKPPHLEGHTFVTCKKLLLLFGGENGDAMTDSSLWTINPDLGYVRKVCPDVGSERPCTRRHHSAVIYDGAMFVYGGYVDLKGSSNDLWCYAVDDEEWTQVFPQQQQENTPGCRHGHSAVVYSKCMWIYGGLSDLTNRQDFWRFRFGTRRWTRLKYKYGPPPLTGHAATVVNDKMLLFGGESNREPTNQLWCYSFSFDSWSQIYIQNQVPSPVSHHAVVLVLHQAEPDPSVKAKSVPQLQQKMTRLSIERPQSSPAYSNRADNQTTEVESLSNQSRRHHELSNQQQGIIRSAHFQRTAHPPDVLNLREKKSSSSDSIVAISSSPQENTKDASPLILKGTDFNYNAIDLSDRNKMADGIDNPGISKSTEELIHESRLRKQYSEVGDNGVENRPSFERLSSETVASDMRTDERASLLRHHSEGVETMIRGGGDFDKGGGDFDDGGGPSVGDKPRHSKAKKKRINSELVIEDIEDCNSFLNKIKVPFPSTKLILNPLLISSSHECLPYSNNIDTLMLQDFSRGQSRSAIQEGYFHEPVNDSGLSTKARSKSCTADTETAEFREGVCVLSKSEVVLMEEFAHGEQKQQEHLEEESETSFNCLSYLSERNNREAKYQKNSSVSRNQRNLRKSKKQPTVLPDPYLLVLGGKEKNGTSFQVKPLSMWKFTLKNV